MGIVLPALRLIREKSRTVICGSNLNQLGFALTIYEQNNNTFPLGFKHSLPFNGSPPSGGYVGDASKDSMGLWWFHFLEQIIGSNYGEKSVFFCPSRTTYDNSSKPNILCGNYGVNQAICKNSRSLGGDFIGKPLNLNSIKKPDQTLLIMDSGYSLISWKAASEPINNIFSNSKRIASFYLPGMEINKNRPIDPSSELDAIYGRHQYKNVNTIYADGHLSFIKSDDLFIEDANLVSFWFPW